MVKSPRLFVHLSKSERLRRSMNYLIITLHLRIIQLYIVDSTLKIMRSFCVIFLFVAALVYVDSKETCKTLDFVNGCSTPLWLPVPFKKAFTPSCNRHDVCYRCVSSVPFT